MGVDDKECKEKLVRESCPESASRQKGVWVEEAELSWRVYPKMRHSLGRRRAPGTRERAAAGRQRVTVSEPLFCLVIAVRGVCFLINSNPLTSFLKKK